MCEFEKLTEDDFNSRAHVERDDLRGIECSECGDFNSRAHVERDYQLFDLINAHSAISTHALTWSATI